MAQLAVIAHKHMNSMVSKMPLPPPPSSDVTPPPPQPQSPTLTPPAKLSCSCTKRSNNQGNLAEASLTKDEELGLPESFRVFFVVVVFRPLEAECVTASQCDDGVAPHGFFCAGVPSLKLHLFDVDCSADREITSSSGSH